MSNNKKLPNEEKGPLTPEVTPLIPVVEPLNGIAMLAEAAHGLYKWQANFNKEWNKQAEIINAREGYNEQVEINARPVLLHLSPPVIHAIPPVTDKVEAAAKVEAATPDETLAALFEAVTVEVLEKMFTAGGRWQSWAEKAASNGLKDARVGRALFNPYKAGLWFLTKRITGWDIARINRTLANNLPARSRDNARLLTGSFD